MQTQKADAFDFRFFIGEYAWQPGEVAAKITAGQYRAVACNAPASLERRDDDFDSFGKQSPPT